MIEARCRIFAMAWGSACKPAANAFSKFTILAVRLMRAALTAA
jgi:hypothetical protein